MVAFIIYLPNQRHRELIRNFVYILYARDIGKIFPAGLSAHQRKTGSFIILLKVSHLGETMAGSSYAGTPLVSNMFLSAN